MLCLLAAAICGCQSQENTGNGGASAGENSAEAETGTETETGNEIRMLKADEETEKYVDYFPADGAYSLCEYNAPEEIRRMDIVRVTRKGDQILEKELVTGTDFAGKENMRSAVIAVWRTEGQLIDQADFRRREVRPDRQRGISFYGRGYRELSGK